MRNDNYPHYSIVLLFRLLQTVNKRKMNDRFKRFSSFTGLARIIPTFQAATVIGLVGEGAASDSLTYRLLSEDPIAILIATIMGVALLASWVEWGRFVFGCSPPSRRHLHAIPYLVYGMCLMIISAAAYSLPPFSPTLVANWMLTGFFVVVVGFRVATPIRKIQGALNGY